MTDNFRTSIGIIGLIVSISLSVFGYYMANRCRGANLDGNIERENLALSIAGGALLFAIILITLDHF